MFGGWAMGRFHMRARNRLPLCVAIALSIGYATPVIAQSAPGAPASTVFKFSNSDAAGRRVPR